MSEQDFLSHCGAGETGNPVLERIRGRSSDIVLAIFRLMKTSFVHALDNAAVKDAATGCAATLDTIAAEIGSAISIAFVSDSIFVCGQLLRAARGAYESAAELGQLLAAVGVSEITFEPGVTDAKLLELAAALVRATRASSGRRSQWNIEGITVRKIDPHILQRGSDKGRSPAEQILKLYATALVLLRSMYADVAVNVTVLPHRVKRVAQRFVVLSEEEDPALLGMTTMAKSHRDDAGRALQSAILSLAMARQVTKDRVVLSQLVMAAMWTEAGHARLRGRAGDRLLSDREEAMVVPAASLACITTGGVNPQSAYRAAMVTEVAWLERLTVLGPVWQGELPSFLASGIVAVARELLERVAPRDGTRPEPQVKAVESIITKPGADPLLGKLLVRALGIIPAGTVVELSSSAWAVVIGASARGPHACVVRVVIDGHGSEVDGAEPIDLGVDESVWIEKIVDAERVMFNTTRTFIPTSAR